MVQGPTPRSAAQQVARVAASQPPQQLNNANIQRANSISAISGSTLSQDSAREVNQHKTAELPNDASRPIQDAQLRNRLNNAMSGGVPQDINELKDMLLEQAENTYGPDSSEAKKIFDKLFKDPESVKKFDKMLKEALKEFKDKAGNPADGQNAMKNLCDFLCQGVRGIANGEDDPGC